MYTKYGEYGKVYIKAGNNVIMRILTILASELLYKLHVYLEEKVAY